MTNMRRLDCRRREKRLAGWRATGGARRAADSPAREARLDLYQGHLMNEGD